MLKDYYIIGLANRTLQINRWKIVIYDFIFYYTHIYIWKFEKRLHPCESWPFQIEIFLGFWSVPHCLVAHNWKCCACVTVNIYNISFGEKMIICDLRHTIMIAIIMKLRSDLRRTVYQCCFWRKHSWITWHVYSVWPNKDSWMLSSTIWT